MSMVENVFRDVRHALKMIAKMPALAAVVILSLGIGIGVGWLVALVRQAVKKFRYDRYFFKKDEAVSDDHLPFLRRGVPSIDIIDLDYGPNNSYHHTVQDTMDKVSARSLTIDGDVFLETIRMVDQK